MFLIPTWVLLTELIILEAILFTVYMRGKETNTGRLAGILSIPLAYIFVTYIATFFVPISEARVLARYAFSVLFFTLILAFGRLLWRTKK